MESLIFAPKKVPVVRTELERLILDTLQAMVRIKDSTIWWTTFDSTPHPDPYDDFQTRSLMHSSPKYEAHMNQCHSSANFDPVDYSGDDNDDDDGNESPPDEPSEWQGQGGDGCRSCEEFKDEWVLEEWVFAAACLMFEGGEVSRESVHERIVENRHDFTLKGWIEERLEEEKEEEEEE